MGKGWLMDLLSKTRVHNNICGLEIDASAAILPSANGSLQPFSNTWVSSSNAVPVYFGSASIKLTQESNQDRNGISFNQKISFRFPNSDILSAERINQFLSVKYIYIKLSGGGKLFFGRNDYFQNTNLKVKIKNTENLVGVEYETRSIFPMGQTNGADDHLLPELLPVNFFNS